MENEIQGTLNAAGMRFGIVVARFNELVTRSLLAGARDALLRHGAEATAIDVVWVPGSFEIPVIARQMARSGRYHAVICLGALIRGATPHFRVLAAAVTSAIQSVATETGVPCVFGVLTADTLEQALERAGSKAGNKGSDAAVAAIEVASVAKQLAERG